MVHAPAVDDPDAEITALEKLAAELAARGFEARLFTPQARLPSLTVASPQAALLAETVITGAGWFWWPWGDRIAPVSDAAAAAGIVARVLGLS
ncbi:MAG TPA: hypothetical protein VMV92_20295 [Streptosporangiaceae bacterium]|nr:hypothetical protein [Streptosporangiaceae bacterium]